MAEPAARSVTGITEGVFTMCRRTASRRSAAAKYLCLFMFLFYSVLGQSQNSTPISAEPAATGYLVACVVERSRDVWSPFDPMQTSATIPAELERT
jgi:hypothetical protein